MNIMKSPIQGRAKKINRNTQMTDQANPLKTKEAILAQDRVSALRNKISALDDEQLNLIFKEARTFNGWQNKPVEDDILETLFNLASMGATSMNCCPARFIFVKSDLQKEKLAACAMPTNQSKIRSAPVNVIIAQDMKFFDEMDYLFPLRDVKPMFEENEELSSETAFRNSSLQGAYFMLAARALGLDCGPLSGFDKQAVDDQFFQNTSIEANFLCSIGYGDVSSIFPRLPRFNFSDICEIV